MKIFFSIFVTILVFSAPPYSHAVGLVNTQFGDPRIVEEGIKKEENPRCGPQGNGDYILCEEVPGIDPVQRDPAAFLRQLYILALALAGTVAFIQIVRGGILYSLSGVVNSKNDAKAIFKGVAQGLALLMGAYLVLNTINPALVKLKFPDAENYFPSVVQKNIFQTDLENLQKTGEWTPEDYAKLTAKDNEAQKQKLIAAQEIYKATKNEIARLQALSDRSPEDTANLRALRETAHEQLINIELEKELTNLTDGIAKKAKDAAYMANVDSIERKREFEKEDRKIKLLIDAQDRKARVAQENFQIKQDEIARLESISLRNAQQEAQLKSLKSSARKDYLEMKSEQGLSKEFQGLSDLFKKIGDEK